MSLSAANFPESLTSESITEVVHQLVGNFNDAFPLFGLFEEKTYNSEKVIVDIVEHIRKVVALSAQPQTANSQAYRRYGQLITQVMYASERFGIPSEHFAALSLPGESTDASRFNKEALERAEEYLADNLRDIVKAMMRTKHSLMAKVLQEANPTFTVDGVDIQVDYGVTVETAGVNWSLPASDILSNFAEHYHAARRALDGEPTHIIYASRMWHDYIPKNDELREFYTRDRLFGGASATEQLTTLIGVPPAMKRIEIDTFHKDSAGADVEHWEKDKIVLARLDPSEGRTLELATARTYDNEQRGGLSAWSVYNDKAPRGVECFVADNGIPIVRQPKKLYVLDISQ